MPIPAAHVHAHAQVAHAHSPPIERAVAHGLAQGSGHAVAVPLALRALAPVPFLPRAEADSAGAGGPRESPGVHGAPIALPLWARVLRRLARGSTALPPSAGGWCV